ncbi:F-box/kelch-repeat protein [Spatholobus suberectus]|nr:F-box/kelch-repeat protein [Spatholobus suberectus]
MQSEKQPWSPVLSDELIEEILSRLPVKTLIRFKSVCKGWYSLISDPSFIKLHLRKSAVNDDLAHLRLMPNVYFGSIPKLYKASCTVSSLFDSQEIVGSIFNSQEKNILRDSFGISNGKLDKYLLVGSCNGLHCVVCERSDRYHVRLWNTATRVISGKSPSPSFAPGGSCGRTKFGFGYDPMTDNYKVVAMSLTQRSHDESLKTEVKVYGMGDNCWRNLQGFPALWCLPIDHGVYLSGTLNWVVIIKDAAKLEMITISVDLGKETCRPLCLPDGLSFRDLKLGVLRDSLCVWQEYKRTHFIIWQMKEFGDDKSWIQLMSFSYLHLQIDPYRLQPMLFPLCTSKNGDICMLLSTGGGVEYQTILYNQRDGMLQSSSIPAPAFTSLIDLNLKIFAESLVMPY